MENDQPKAKPIIEEETDIVAKTKKYRKQFTGLFIVVAVIMLAVLGIYMIRHSQAEKANEAIALADAEQNDSIALVLYKDAATHGTKSGDRAKVEAAIRLYQAGNYEEALTYLDDASASDEIVAAGIQVLKGDCHVNLKNYDAAIDAYDAAISDADNNPALVPVILVKKANVYHEQKNYAAEAHAYEQIIKNYPSYGKSTAVDVHRYFERAKAAANQQ